MRLLFICLIFISSLLYGQIDRSELECVILDGLSSKCIELVNFVLLHKNDSSMANGAVSDKNGVVRLSRIPYGEYIIVISFIGYSKRNIQLSINQPLTNLDTIKLEPISVQLNQVVVKGSKEVIEYKDDRIVFNVAKDGFSQGGSAILALENAPLIHVDVNENISMIGKQELVICIDGVSIIDMGMSNKEMLETLPSSDIDKIEIFTSAPPEYSSSLTTGVINIILKKNDNKKYSGLIRVSGETNNKYNAGVSVNYKLPAGNLRAGVSGNYLNNEYSSYMHRNSIIQDKSILLDQIRKGTNASWIKSFSLNYYYPIDKKSSLNQFVSYKHFDKEKINDIHNSYTQNDSLISEQLINNLLDVNTGFFNYFISYNKIYERRGQRLNLGFSYINNLMTLKSDIVNNEINLNQKSNSNNNSNNRNISYLFKSSYNHPINEGSTLNLVANATLKNLTLESDYFSKIDEISEKRLNQKYKQINYDLYPNFSSSMWGFDYSITLSIRGIHILNMEKYSNESYKYNYTNIYPGLNIRKKISQSFNLHFSGGVGVLYPANKELNPYVDVTDSANIEVGNPLLNPSKSGMLSMSCNYLTPDISLSSGINLSKGWDMIERYTSQLNARTTLTTYKNAGNYLSYNGFLEVEYSSFSWLKSRLSGQVYKINFENSVYSNNEISWGLYFNSNFMFDRIHMKIDISYTPPLFTSQTKTKEYISMNVGGRIKLDEVGKFYLFFTVRDLMNNYQDEKNIYSNNFISVIRNRQTTRTFYLGFTYFFQAADNPEYETEEVINDDF